VHVLSRSLIAATVLIVSLVNPSWSQTSPAPSPATTPKQGNSGASNAPTGAKQSAPSKPGQSTSASKDSKDGQKDAPKPRQNVAPAASKKNTLALSPLLASDWQRGCGCRFYKPTDQKENGPLLLRLTDKKKGQIRSEGKLESLDLIDEKHIQKKPPAILAKDRMMLKFKGNNLTASFSGSAERNCPKFQDSCKAVSYQGVLTLSQMGKQGSFPTWGLCGC
jgi:hypothetical protein